MSLRYAVLDVFTDTALTGNPLAVVLRADRLSDERMLAIAREFNLSETVFVMKADNPAHTAKVRIFTPGGEVPFAGHPTVGTAVLLAGERLGKVSEDQDAIIVLEENIGPVRCGVIVRPNGRGFAEFDAPMLSQPAGETASAERIAAALGLAKSEIGFENHRPSRYEAGLEFTFVPVNGLDAIAKAQIVPALWTDAFGAGRNGIAACVYVYCRDTVRHDCDFHARMFTPTGGIGEDPATGSAAAAFAGVVKVFDDPWDGTHIVHIEQGVEMGRPSCIKLEIDVAGGELHAKRIGGDAIIVAEGKLRL